MALTVNNNISGLSNLAKTSCSSITDVANRIATSKKLAKDDIVASVISKDITDKNSFSRGLLKTISSGVNQLKVARDNLYRISDLLTKQLDLVHTAEKLSINQLKVAFLNQEFQMEKDKISSIASKAEFIGAKLLDGTFGVERREYIENETNANAISLASKKAPIGPLKFLRDNIALLPFESSSSILSITNIIEGDYVLLSGERFVFTSKPEKPNDIKLTYSIEEMARELITKIMNSDQDTLKKYALSTAGGGIITIQSLARSGDKIPLSSSDNVRLNVDNVTGQADENVINLNNILNNADFIGRVKPDFTHSNGQIAVGPAALVMATNNAMDLGGYGGDAGDCCAEFTCAIGERTYKGPLFIRGVGGVVQTVGGGAAGAEKGKLTMREVGNEGSSFTINFDLAYTGAINSTAVADLVADDINELFTRITFRQTRRISVNEAPDRKALRIFDAKTMSAAVTGSDLDELKIEDFQVTRLTDTMVQMSLTINGSEYKDVTVSRNLMEGERISLEKDSTNYISVTIGKGGLRLYAKRDILAFQKAFLTYLTNQEQFLSIRVANDLDSDISTKIDDYRPESLYLDDDGSSIKSLNILDKASRKQALAALRRASQMVLAQISAISNSINSVQNQIERVNNYIEISRDTSRHMTDADLVKEATAYERELKELAALIAVQSGTSRLDETVIEQIMKKDETPKRQLEEA